IELHIAFYWHDDIQPFEYEGIHYYPIYRKGIGSKLQRVIQRFRTLYFIKTEIVEIERCKKIIDIVKPDIVHIHGTEENFGLVCQGIQYPHVISIQGLLSSIKYKLFSGYTKEQIKKYEPYLYKLLFSGVEYMEKMFQRNSLRELMIIRNCDNIIGRTKWDYDCTLAMNPHRKYYHCDELIRTEFHEHQWTSRNCRKTIHLATTISSGIYKGFETIFLTASQLKTIGVDIVWNIIGVSSDDNTVKSTEKLLGINHKDINIKLRGRKDAAEIIEILKETDIYIQASHIENSPNNVCEAMLLGMPIIATMAGGTSSLLADNKEGYLIQDGDPYSMVGAILHCIDNYEEAVNFGANARNTATERHNREKVMARIINIYKEIIGLK
ncbi:MAG: glycosyltransferase, partial [Prevotella sp.]|nr:glycosyltransferase [Prevotella sp.]